MNMGYEDDDLKPYVEPEPEYNDLRRIGKLIDPPRNFTIILPCVVSVILRTRQFVHINKLQKGIHVEYSPTLLLLLQLQQLLLFYARVFCNVLLLILLRFINLHKKKLTRGRQPEFLFYFLFFRGGVCTNVFFVVVCLSVRLI